jgi:hypothetical protein
LYRRGTFSVTKRKEHGLRVSENRVLRRIFGPKRGEAAGELRFKICTLGQIKQDEMGEA